eukprot:983735-Alexandrium_andersonii.AAC.1
MHFASTRFSDPARPGHARPGWAGGKSFTRPGRNCSRPAQASRAWPGRAGSEKLRARGHAGMHFAPA